MFEDQFNQLMDQAESLDYGKERMDVYEEAIRLSESEQEWYANFIASYNLAETAYFVGEFDVMIDIVLYCLEFFDQNEEVLKEDWALLILWQYKWVLEKCVLYPGCTVEEIEKMLADFKEKSQKYGFTLRTFYQYQHRIAKHMGNIALASDFYDKWLLEERDDLSDCDACETNMQMEYLFDIGETVEAMEKAKAILEGNISCEEVPELTYAKLLLPFYKDGRIDEAKELQTEGYFLIYQKPHLLTEAADHILFLSLVNPIKATAVYEKFINTVSDDSDPYSQYKFALASWFMLEKCKKTGIFMNTDEEFFKDITLGIANDYDHRNGNTFYMDKIQEVFSYLN